MPYFFLDGNIPNNVNDAQRFLQRLEDSGEEGLRGLSKEVDQFYWSQLSDFLDNVMPLVRDERIIDLVYHSHRALSHVNHTHFLKCFGFIHDRHQKNQIDPVLYEACAANLVRAYVAADRPINLLAEMKAFAKKSNQSQELLHTFPGNGFDKLMAKHLSKVLVRYDPRVFKNAKDALLKFELPNCLQLMLEDRINAGEINEVASFLREFFIGNKLTDKYLDVFRKVLGDDAFLEIINRNITSPSSIHPVVKLSAIFGEEAFHTPQFLDSLVWNRDGELPVHLVRFSLIGFDETKLPLLADYLMANLDPATKIHKSVGGVAYVADLAKMAVRMNRGFEVIEALTTNLAGFTNLVKPSRSEAINELHRLGGEVGWQVSKTRAFTLLLDVVEIVGLKALHDLAPDVNARVLGEFMDTKKTDLTEQQIIKLFPQASGHILGHALGL